MTTLRVGEGSEVQIGFGLPDEILPARPDRRKVAILTQPGPAARQASMVSRRCSAAEILEVADRDAAKTLTQVGKVYDWLHRLNLGRHDTVVGVGGGAVTDLAGFVAATWLRGIESVLVPTTLLGAVDAAIGGKTGINHLGKNLVGAFWPPSRVVVDLEVLDALPRHLLVEGSAEIVKAGYIADPSILDEYRAAGAGARLEIVVPKAIAVKTEVVADDLRETGRRAILNFGHTIGHAIETLAAIPHGHAVAVGMVAAAEISAGRHRLDAGEVRGLLERVGLPVVAPRVAREQVVELLWHDKKRSAEGVRMVLLRGLADPVVEVVSAEEIELGLTAIGID